MKSPSPSSGLVGTTPVTFVRCWGYGLPRESVPPKAYRRQRWWFGDWLRRVFG